MRNTFAFALLISLATTPVLARQSTGPARAERDAVGQAPAGPRPRILPPSPVPPPEQPIPTPFLTEPLMDTPPVPMFNLPAIDIPMIDMAAISEAMFLVDRLAFDFGQERSKDKDKDREAQLREREREREQQLYAQAHDAVNDYRWERALTYFTRVVELKGSKLDAALYWKAYSQNRLGQRAEALNTIAELTKTQPTSSYRKQATMLEAEVRRDIGQPVRPQDSADDEVKLMALQALQHTAPDEAIPILGKVLEGTASPKVKQRALFVLAQSKSPRARDVLRNYARGSSTPELQNQAIRYLGVHGGPESRAALEEIYSGTSDLDVKRRILRAYMISGEKARLLKAAQGEQNAELRAEAVGQLGTMSAHDELWQLYQKESSIDVKRRIIRSMHVGGSVDRLIDLAKSEQNPELRREAVRALGLMRSTRTGDTLVQIYGSDTSVDVRKAVVNALFLQENATALVALARKEQDTSLRNDIVGRLSMMRTKVAVDYMLELLGK